MGTTRSVLSGTHHGGARSASDAFEAPFGPPARTVGSGGSIPVAIDFREALGAGMVISGLAMADSAAHSPNEKFSLDHYHRGIEMLLRFMYGSSPEHPRCGPDRGSATLRVRLARPRAGGRSPFITLLDS
jgi:hypothetical protein